MGPFRRGLLLLVVPLVVVPVLADGPGDAPEDNRRLLEKWRQDPQHYARLQQDLAAFRRLPPEKQEPLRKLDRDLQSEGPGMRARLLHVLDRYADWLDQLPEADRESIARAPGRKAKLQRIREIRQRQWAQRLPRAQFDQLQKLPEEERARQINKLWQEDLEQRADWQTAMRHGDGGLRAPGLPTNRETLPPEVRKYLDESLKPLLSKEEDKRLKDAEGMPWPRYPRVLVELVDSHPLSLLGPIGPTGSGAAKDMVPMPAALRDLLNNPKEKGAAIRQLKADVKDAEGKWPEFGVVIRDFSNKPLGKKHGLHLEARYAPSQPQHLPTGIQEFLEKKLLPVLDADERAALSKAQGHWPAYPRTILDLALKHNLPVPLERPLPGRFDFWDHYRGRSVLGATEPFGRRDPLALVP